jgi:probable rRNA maturation factor
MIINRQRRVRVAVKPLEEFLGRVKEALRLSRRDLTVCLVDVPTIARLNRAFRRERGPTDVLSFPVNGKQTRQGRAAGRPRVGVRYLGDIAISPATARRNARRLGRTLSQELRVLILHGVLHLAGHDHETDRGEMDRLERRLRRRWGLS